MYGLLILRYLRPLRYEFTSVGFLRCCVEKGISEVEAQYSRIFVAVPVLALNLTIEWNLFPVPFFLVSQLEKAYMEFHFFIPASEFDF